MMRGIVAAALLTLLLLCTGCDQHNSNTDTTHQSNPAGGEEAQPPHGQVLLPPIQDEQDEYDPLDRYRYGLFDNIMERLFFSRFWFMYEEMMKRSISIGCTQEYGDFELEVLWTVLEAGESFYSYVQAYEGSEVEYTSVRVVSFYVFFSLYDRTGDTDLSWPMLVIREEHQPEAPLGHFNHDVSHGMLHYDSYTSTAYMFVKFISWVLDEVESVSFSFTVEQINVFDSGPTDLTIIPVRFFYESMKMFL